MSIFDQLRPNDRKPQTIPLVVLKDGNQLSLIAGDPETPISNALTKLKDSLRQNMIRVFHTAGSTKLVVDFGSDTIHVTGHSTAIGQADTETMRELLIEEIQFLRDGPLRSRLLRIMGDSSRFTGTKDGADVVRHTLERS